MVARSEFVESAQFVNIDVIELQVVMLQEGLEHFVALVLFLFVLFAETCLYLAFGLGGSGVLEPLMFDLLIVGRNDFDLIAPLQLIHDRLELVIDFCTDTVCT